MAHSTQTTDLQSLPVATKVEDERLAMMRTKRRRSSLCVVAAQLSSSDNDLPFPNLPLSPNNKKIKSSTISSLSSLLSLPATPAKEGVPSYEDLGYGDDSVPSFEDVGYGAPAPKRVKLNHTTSLNKKRSPYRRRCSVTRFSLQASAENKLTVEQAARKVYELLQHSS